MSNYSLKIVHEERFLFVCTKCCTFYQVVGTQKNMMNLENVSYCGITCTECPAYLAKQNNDDALREKTAKQWNSEEFPLTAQDIDCDGCRTDSGDLMKFCHSCKIRSCARGRGVKTCAHCDGYVCDKLEEQFAIVGEEARARLERIREAIKQT